LSERRKPTLSFYRNRPREKPGKSEIDSGHFPDFLQWWARSWSEKGALYAATIAIPQMAKSVKTTGIPV
jgi:hypothetical protein